MVTVVDRLLLLLLVLLLLLLLLSKSIIIEPLANFTNNNKLLSIQAGHFHKTFQIINVSELSISLSNDSFSTILSIVLV